MQICLLLGKFEQNRLPRLPSIGVPVKICLYVIDGFFEVFEGERLEFKWFGQVPKLRVSLMTSFTFDMIDLIAYSTFANPLPNSLHGQQYFSSGPRAIARANSESILAT